MEHSWISRLVVWRSLFRPRSRSNEDKNGGEGKFGDCRETWRRQRTGECMGSAGVAILCAIASTNAPSASIAKALKVGFTASLGQSKKILYH